MLKTNLQNNNNMPIPNVSEPPLTMPNPNPSTPNVNNTLANKAEPVKPTIASKNLLSSFDPKQKKIIKILSIFVGGLIFLLVISSLIPKRRNGGNTNEEPQGSFSPIPVATAPSVPSRYASDSAILKIEDDMKKLDLDINSFNTFNSNLKPPELYFDQNFEK